MRSQPVAPGSRRLESYEAKADSVAAASTEKSLRQMRRGWSRPHGERPPLGRLRESVSPTIPENLIPPPVWPWANGGQGKNWAGMEEPSGRVAQAGSSIGSLCLRCLQGGWLPRIRPAHWRNESPRETRALREEPACGRDSRCIRPAGQETSGDLRGAGAAALFRSCWEGTEAARRFPRISAVPQANDHASGRAPSIERLRRFSTTR